MSEPYEVIVIGGGHAGAEAALAAARLGKRTLLLTLSLDNIALMPCNPSVGGPGKSQLVMELDALGGEMGKVADDAAIQYRMLNTGKGPAVHALRAQADKRLYQILMKEHLENTANLEVRQLLVDSLLTEEGKVTGVVGETGERFYAKAVILATGTYLRGRIIIGECVYDGGPNGQRPAMRLSSSLEAMGLKLMRFKTGTPARVAARSLNYDVMQIQEGDTEARAFSFMRPRHVAREVVCHLTYTNEETHRILRENMSRAPMANGVIVGEGPRYCPSIETKVLRFPDKERHQLFLEPEGLHTREVYVQGMSTSMPMDVQFAFLRTIQGMEQMELMRPGYAIEYDCFDPLQLTPALAFKRWPNLFSAGQANGTSGYEEAAAQGLMAGINAARYLDGKEPLVLRRSEAYIGVLIDDLVTKGTKEPYRMMTSRAEYRLLLREDNADLRLTAKGREVGLVDDERWAAFQKKRDEIAQAKELLTQLRLNPNEATLAQLAAFGEAPIKESTSALQILGRGTLPYSQLGAMLQANLPEISAEAAAELRVMARYEGYIRKQEEQVRRMERLEAKHIPQSLDYHAIQSLRLEAIEKLTAVRPRTVGQASRISGVSPADVSVLLIYLEQQGRKER